MAAKKSAKKSTTKSAGKKTSGSKKSTSPKASSKKTASKKAGSKKTAPRKASQKRTLIEPTPGDKRYVRRDAAGLFKKVVDVGRSLAADLRSKSKTAAKAGQGDKGDVKRARKK